MNRRETLKTISATMLGPYTKYINFPVDIITEIEILPKFIIIDLTNTNQIHLYSERGNLSFYKSNYGIICFNNNTTHYIPTSKNNYCKYDFTKITEKSMKTSNIDYFEIINGDESNLFALGY